MAQHEENLTNFDEPCFRDIKMPSFWSDRLTEGAATAAAMHAEKVCERIKECGNELSTPAMRLAYDLRHGFSQPLQRAKLSFSRR